MKRVLIIEDNDDNLYLIKFILETSNISVIYAKNGKDGYDTAIHEKPDLVLMDIQLPDINGLEVTKRIRQVEGFADMPIIAITSYAMTGDRQKALNAGCTGYIEKPIDPETFKSTVEKFLL